MNFTENYFYCSALLSPSPRLDEKEAHHALKVLRLSQGDTVLVTNGQGALHECTLEKRVGQELPLLLGKPIGSRQGQGSIELAIAVLKKPAFEAVLEWCGQLPIRSIRPFLSSRVTVSIEYLLKGQERLQEKLTVALKQSKQVWLPTLFPPVSFEELLKKYKAAQVTPLLFEKSDELPSPALPQSVYKSETVAVIVGPEGGLSEEEIHFAKENNSLLVSLGHSRLRAESAAFASIVKTLTLRECHETRSQEAA